MGIKEIGGRIIQKLIETKKTRIETAEFAAATFVEEEMGQFERQILNWKEKIDKSNIKTFDMIWKEITEEVMQKVVQPIEDIENKTGENLSILHKLIPRLMVAIFLKVLGYKEELREVIMSQGKEKLISGRLDKDVLMFLLKKVYEETEREMEEKMKNGTLGPGAAIFGDRVLGEIFYNDGVFPYRDKPRIPGIGIIKILYEGKKREVEIEYKKKGEELTSEECHRITIGNLGRDDMIPLFAPELIPE